MMYAIMYATSELNVICFARDYAIMFTNKPWQRVPSKAEIEFNKVKSGMDINFYHGI